MSAHRRYDATVARIAGNLLSGCAWLEREPVANGPWAYRVNRQIVGAAVEAARAIVSEVERTEPEAAK